MSSSDETTTHEQLTETRSWSEYDEDGNVTADHTTVRAICGTCYREQIDRHGHLEYVSADWPCDGAENARLRERVAALEGTAEQSDWRVLKLTDALADALLLIHETRHDGAPAGCAERICEIGKQLVQTARDSVVDNLAAALAQVDGRA